MGVHKIRFRAPYICKNLKINLWSSIDEADILIYMIDILRFNYKNIIQDIKKLSEVKKPILLLFNKIDLVDKNEILPKIDLLKDIQNIASFLSISAKKNIGINELIKFKQLKLIILVGERQKKAYRKLKHSGQTTNFVHIQRKSEFPYEQLESSLKEESVILIKGSRGMKMERFLEIILGVI